VKEEEQLEQKGQSIVIVTIAVTVLMIFVIIAVDLAYAYVHRRGDQNAADAAAIAGTRALADILNANSGTIPGAVSETSILQAMNDYAERNGAEDTNDTLADAVNANVQGYYLDQDGNRLSGGGADIRIGQVGWVNPNARGVEAIVHSIAPSFFGGILGLDGLPIQAEAAVVIEAGVCAAGCLAPIATLTTTFEFDECYNIFDGPTAGGEDQGGDHAGWACALDNDVLCDTDADCDLGPCKQNNRCTGDAQRSCTVDDDCYLGLCEEVGEGVGGGSGGAGGFGWLNWSWQGQGHSCKDIGMPDDCSAVCTEYNLEPLTCLSGNVEVGDWVASTAGLMTTPSKLSGKLDKFIDEGIYVTIIIYDVYEGTGCGKLTGTDKHGLAYHVVGFAEFELTGYRLPQGQGGAVMRDTIDPDTCIDWGSEGNRITGKFKRIVRDGIWGDCPYFGISATRMVK
jgi:hypothetical protein